MKKPNATRKHPKSTRTRPAGKASTKTPKVKQPTKPITLNEIAVFLNGMGDLLEDHTRRLDDVYRAVKCVGLDVQSLL